MPSPEEKENPDVESESGNSAAGISLTESAQVLPTLVRRPSLGQEASLVSEQSDTTLEFHDAPAPEDLMATLKEHQANNSMDQEVTVRLPNTCLLEHMPPVEEKTTSELPEERLHEKELNIAQENDAEEDLSNGERPSDTQEAHNESEEIEVHVNIENDLVREVTEEQLKETSGAQVLKLDMVMEPELVSVQEPSLEPLTDILEHPEIQEPTEAEESLNTSSFFVEALSVPPTLEPVNKSMEENAAYDTIGESAVTEVSEAVPEELVCEASESKIPVVELVNHEQMTSEPEINEECEGESMETSGVFFYFYYLFIP